MAPYGEPHGSVPTQRKGGAGRQLSMSIASYERREKEQLKMLWNVCRFNTGKGCHGRKDVRKLHMEKNGSRVRFS
jgi:hypothetical protein